jgi:RHS repeat-associated protein
MTAAAFSAARRSWPRLATPARRRMAACMALLAIVIACAAMPGFAQSCGPSVAGSPCATAQPAGMDSTGGVGQAAGNPINIITGNKYQREADMPALPGALGLELVRHYNSHRAAPGMPLQGIGRGWQFSYDTRLHVQGNTLQIIQADGARIIFARSAWNRTVCTASDPAQGRVRIARSGGRPEYRWRWPSGRELSFDHHGRLVRISDSDGMEVVIERMEDGRISVVIDPQGRSMTFHYLHRKEDRPGRYRGVQSVDTPVGRFLYDYDYGDAGAGAGAGADASGDPGPPAFARLRAVHLPTRYDPAQPRPTFRLGDTPATSSVSTVRRVYHHEDSRFPTLLTGITVDGAGSDGKPMRERIATWAYDRNGLAVLSIRHDAARGPKEAMPEAGSPTERLRFDRGEPGRTRVTDGQGRVTTYRHAIVAGAFRLLEARGAGCGSCGPVNVRYRYDRHGRVEEVVTLDKDGTPLTGRRQQLDALGRPYAQKQLRYGRGKQPPHVALVLRQQFPYPGLTAAWPGAGGEPAHFGPMRIAEDSVVSGNTHQVRLAYNARQQVLQVTETGYDPVSRSASTRLTRFRYKEIDGRSLLAEVDGPLPNGPAGTPADSDITRYEWDARGAYVRKIALPMGPTLDITHDAHTGRPQTVRYRWDGVVRTSRYAYGSNGQVTRHHETAFAADGTTVLAEREVGLASNARNEISRIAWPDGRVEEVMRRWSGNHAAWAPPADAGLPALDQPDVLRHDSHGKSAERLIDDFGQVVGIRNPGQGWQYARYDAAGRLTEMRDARGMVTSASHDAAGRLLRISRKLPGDAYPERLEFGWDGPYKVVETVETEQRRMHASHYTHTPWGQVSQKRVEIAAATAGDTPASMTTASNYDAAGRLATRTLPGGERVAYRYHATNAYYGQRAAVERLHWPRWLDWLMTRVPETWLDRIGLKTRLIDFAPQDNVAGAGAGAETDVLSLLANRQTTAPEAEPGIGKAAPGEQHDAAGLPRHIDTATGSFTLRWNAASQLVSVRSAGAAPGNEIASYTYDAHGRRASKRSAAGAECYLYEGTQLLAIESRPLRGPSRTDQYLYEGYRPIAWLRDGMALLLQTDHRGAVDAVRSAEREASTRTTLWRGDPGPWGKSPITDSVDTRYDPHLRLVNQLADEETGLSYHLARYYDPATGRFISPDPAGIADTLDSDVPQALRLDLTAYAAGQPNRYFDPDGAARLIYYAMTTGADGKQLGVEKSNFIKARWAFSIDGIEASGDGGSDAINALMEKYAKNQTGMLFDKGGNFIEGKKNAVSWNGASDETVDGFTTHYGTNLISMRQFVIADYSNKDAALLIANLINDKDGENLCKDVPALMPQIRFGAGEDSIVVTRPKGVDPNNPANLQRIVNCDVNKQTSLPVAYADDLERERVERIEAAAEMNEYSAINPDCSSNGCPGVTISGQPGENGEPARQYHASYGRSQFVAATFIETLDNLPPSDKLAIGLNGDLQRRIKLARARAVSINGVSGLFDFARKFSCGNSSFTWDHAGEIGALTVEERASFQSKSSLDRQNFIDIVCFVPTGNGRPIGEARNAFMTESIFSDAILKNWLMNLYKSYDAFNLTSRIFIRNNLRKVLDSSALSERLKNKEPKETTNEKEKYRFEKRQREIEDELGMRTARLHNGGGGGLTGDIASLTRTCVPGQKIPCDTGDYVKTFIGLKTGRGD